MSVPVYQARRQITVRVWFRTRRVPSRHKKPVVVPVWSVLEQGAANVNVPLEQDVHPPVVLHLCDLIVDVLFPGHSAPDGAIPGGLGGVGPTRDVVTGPAFPEWPFNRPRCASCSRTSRRSPESRRASNRCTTWRRGCRRSYATGTESSTQRRTVRESTPFIWNHDPMWHFSDVLVQSLAPPPADAPRSDRGCGGSRAPRRGLPGTYRNRRVRGFWE